MATMPSSYEELLRRRNEMRRIATFYGQKLEDQFIDNILVKHDNNISRASKEEGISRSQIHRRLRGRNPQKDL